MASLVVVLNLLEEVVVVLRLVVGVVEQQHSLI